MRKKLFVSAFCLILVFSFAGCKKKAAEPKVETIGDITYIYNLSTPLHPNKTVAFEEEFTFREKDASGEIRLFKPGRYAVDEKDNAYISDESDMAIKVFDAQGKFLRIIGRTGNGPGEFENIGYVVILPDGRILVTDYQTRRTSFFSPDGQFISSFQLKKSYSRVYLTTNTSYTTSESVFSKEKRELWVKKIDFSGEELFAFGKFTFPEMKTLRQGNIMIGTSVPWSPMSIFAGDQKRLWLYHCLNDKYLIEVYDQQGKVFRKIDRSYEPLPVTNEDIQKIKSRYAERPDSPGAKLLEQMEIPKIKTITERLLVDSDGNLWVETNEDRKEAEKTFKAYDIFNPEGFYDAKVWSELTPGLFANDKMYRMAEDEQTGMRLLKRYRVIWNENK